MTNLDDLWKLPAGIRALRQENERLRKVADAAKAIVLHNNTVNSMWDRGLTPSESHMVDALEDALIDLEYTPPPDAQTVTPPRSWWYRVCERVAKAIGGWLANLFFGRVPGGRK